MNESLPRFLALLVPVAPLVSALVTARSHRPVSDSLYRTAWWGFVIGLVASLAVLVRLIADPAPIRLLLFESPWHFLPQVTLSIDRLAAVMMVLISGLGTLLYRFSIRYLQQDPAQPRFHTLFGLCVASLLLMVSSSDLVTLVVSWQLLSVFLPLLIHNYAHGPTTQSSFRIFVTLRLGDVAFIAGIALAYKFFGTVEFAPLFERAAESTAMLDLGWTSLRASTAVLILIFIGAMCKSAQFPLHLWLPDSLFAPTPVSGLLHAGIINSGGFLLNRLAPLYSISTPTLHVIFFVGLVTMIVGTAMMLVQNDIKKGLVYSTVGQMGFMIMECGLGAFALAVFHLIAHGLFKATLFLNSGDVIRQARRTPKRPPATSSSGEQSAGSGWLLGFLASLALPLGILVAVHEILGINVKDAQGLQIFLFFSWVTASHAMLTLYRVKKTGAAAQGALLTAITLIAAAYLFAAEVFAHFLYEDEEVVQYYFDAAALPEPVFFGIALVTVMLMGAAWVLAYRREQAAANPFTKLRTGLYLLLMNDFYLDGLFRRVHSVAKRLVRGFDRSGLFGAAIVAIATAALAFLQMTETPTLTGSVIPVLLCGVVLPLFPLHGLYVRFVTRSPRTVGVLASMLLPLVGLCVLVAVLPKIPVGMLPGIEVLALGGAVYGSLKALVQPRAQGVLAYGGLALHSISWWHIANAGEVTPEALVFTISTALAFGGLLMAWNCIRRRYGDLKISEFGGLFRQMPTLAMYMALLVLAAAGLPPGGLFFGYLGMLTAAPEALSASSFFVFFAWFVSSWYLYRLMQRLLFGPHRQDLRYEVLRPSESSIFLLVIGALVFLGSAPQGWTLNVIHHLATVMGGTP